MDESKVSKVAQQLNIPLSEALGVAINKINAGLLTKHEVSEYLNVLQQAGRRINGHVINKVRDYINE